MNVIHLVIHPIPGRQSDVVIAITHTQMEHMQVENVTSFPLSI